MEAFINGKKRVLPDKTSLADLLLQSNIKPEQVVVEHNGNIVERDKLASIFIAQNDTIEIVHFVGGG